MTAFQYSNVMFSAKMDFEQLSAMKTYVQNAYFLGLKQLILAQLMDIQQ